jgi:hypothetical protein
VSWPQPTLGHNVRRAERHTRRVLSLLSTVSGTGAYTEGGVLQGTHLVGATDSFDLSAVQWVPEILVLAWRQPEQATPQG